MWLVSAETYRRAMLLIEVVGYRDGAACGGDGVPAPGLFRLFANGGLDGTNVTACTLSPWHTLQERNQ